jgi:hypothetical protein
MPLCYNLVVYRILSHISKRCMNSSKILPYRIEDFNYYNNEESLSQQPKERELIYKKMPRSQ